MSSSHTNNYPKLHNAMWPGLVGKGSPGAEPAIDLDTMLDLTARAEVDGIRFDGVDLFLFDPHISIDADEDGIKRLAEKVTAKGFVVGSVVAPVWQPTGGGSALGSETDREKFVGQVRKACHIAKTLRELGVRPEGVVRIDSACSVADWAQDQEGNQQRIAKTFAEACDVAESFGERLAAEGEICWGGMHSWKKMLDLLERVNRPHTLGFQADMAHTLLYIVGYNAPEDALLPADWDWSDPSRLDEALKTLTDSLRPWTIDFHVAQNDATVKGSGNHDNTGHHCLPNDPNGKLDIPRHAGFWLRAEGGEPNKSFRHICWDGCMFPNEVMSQPETWNDILAAMVAVRDAHGWVEPAEELAALPTQVVEEVEVEIDREPAQVEIGSQPEAPEAAPAEPPEAAPVEPAKLDAEPVAPVRAKVNPVKPSSATKKVSKSHFVKPAKVKKVQPKPAKVKRAPAKAAKAKHVRTRPVKVKQGRAKSAVAKRSPRAKPHRSKTARKASLHKKPSTRVSGPKRAVARKKAAVRRKRNR